VIRQVWLSAAGDPRDSEATILPCGAFELIGALHCRHQEGNRKR